MVGEFLGKIDGELRKIEQKPLSKNYADELEWIRNTKAEMCKVEGQNLGAMAALRGQLQELVGPAGAHKLDGCAAKIREIEDKVG